MIFGAPSLPLPQDVPIHFRVLPEFVLEDDIDYSLFTVWYVSPQSELTHCNWADDFRHSPNSFELSGKNELVIFALRPSANRSFAYFWLFHLSNLIIDSHLLIVELIIYDYVALMSRIKDVQITN